MNMTKKTALEIQTAHIEWYARLYPSIDVAGIVAKATTADQLPDGEHDVVVINRHIPRGASIEMLIGKFDNHSD